MKILVVDRSAESQARIARIIENFDTADRDMLDLVVALASDQDYVNKAAECDVIVFGSGLESDLPEFARTARATNPGVEMIAFISSNSYSSGTFRAAHNAKVRKVIPDNSSPLDLLQELVAVHEQYRINGRMREGKLTVIMQAKGGIGVTTLTAALGRISSEHGRQTLLWDMDIESRDLSRAVKAQGPQDQLVSGWVKGSIPLTRETLRQAIVPVGDNLSLLPPPGDITAGMDLVGNPDHVTLMQHMVDLARVTHDHVLVDMAGRMGAGTGALLRNADTIIGLVDDSLLGLSGAHAFLKALQPLLKMKSDALKIICNASSMRRREIISVLSQGIVIPETAWVTEPLPPDTAASSWPGTGSSLYDLGQRATRRALIDIAVEVGVLGAQPAAAGADPRKGWKSLFTRSRRTIEENVAVNGSR